MLGIVATETSRNDEVKNIKKSFSRSINWTAGNGIVGNEKRADSSRSGPIRGHLSGRYDYILKDIFRSRNAL